MLTNTIYLQENPQTAARFAGSMLMNGYTTEEIMHYDEAIESVKVEDVKKVWEKVMLSKTRVSGYLEKEDE
jgi:predicted Zn-dependent peptidase